MSKIRVDLESVQVTEGEGIGEGDFELRIQVQEGTNHMVWPSLNSSARIDKGGAAYTINREIGTYSVSSGTTPRRGRAGTSWWPVKRRCRCRKDAAAMLDAVVNGPVDERPADNINQRELI
jgi:hypothetical protein